MSNTIEILRWTVYTYRLVANAVGTDTAPAGRESKIEVRTLNGMGPWLVLTVTGAHTVGPQFDWSPFWWSEKSDEELRRSIERTVVTAGRAHWAKECQG